MYKIDIGVIFFLLPLWCKSSRQYIGTRQAHILSIPERKSLTTLGEVSLVPFLFLSLIIVYGSIIKNVCIYLVYFIKISSLFSRVLICANEV